MADGNLTTEDPASASGAASSESPRVLALLVAWAAGEHHRIGEIAHLPARRHPYVLGRGGEISETSHARVVFARQRPGELTPSPPLASRALSRDQLEIVAHADHLDVERTGRCAMAINGVVTDRGALTAGDTLVLHGQLVCLCVSRAAVMPPPRYAARSSWGPFGEPDALGIVGESEATWRLRDELAFAGKASAHVLLTGGSGTGKELAARAVHALSGRGSRRFVARNAATFPATLIDAELFGNASNYPNPGTPERPGLIGEADGGTLFLDEIGELAPELQAHLLRVLDEGGEYQRLGEATGRRANVRLIAATNRPPAALKPDFLARFAVRIDVPALDARRDDLPLLLRHLGLVAVRKSPEIAERFVLASGSGRLDLRLHPAFVEHVLRASHPTNVRDLDAALWDAMRDSAGDAIGRAPAVTDPAPSLPEDPTVDQLRAAVASADGNLSKAARTLGLTSRYALYRLLKRHGLDAGDLRDRAD